MTDPRLSEEFLSVLERVNGPEDLRKLSTEELEHLCQELRTELWDTITAVGGHLAASLGVVELTVALHYVYNTPADKLVWDVGHQGYIHKILTGRRKLLPTIRQYKGLSGFLNAVRANTIRLARDMLPRPSARLTAWPWRAICKGKITTSWPSSAMAG